MKLQKAADDTAVPGYRYLLEHIFIEIDQPLTVLVIAGEICVGFALIRACSRGLRLPPRCS